MYAILSRKITEYPFGTYLNTTVNSLTADCQRVIIALFITELCMREKNS